MNAISQNMQGDEVKESAPGSPFGEIGAELRKEKTGVLLDLLLCWRALLSFPVLANTV